MGEMFFINFAKMFDRKMAIRKMATMRYENT